MIAGAHGICGILLMLMHCLPELEELYPKAWSLIMETLNSLRGRRFPSGNLSSSLGSESDK